MTERDSLRRTFLGIGLDDATRDLLAAHLEAHLPGGVPGKPVPPSNWHMTLRFLGMATDLQLDRLLYEMGEGGLPGPWRVRFEGLGAFPRPSRATVLWLGVAGGTDELAALASTCEEAAVAAGFAVEDRPFHPHLTLSRIRPSLDVEPLTESLPPFDVAMSVTEVTLYESHLGSGGARYETIERITL